MCRIISFVSVRGGLGKTSVIKLLAEGLAKRGFKVCVFDGVFCLNEISFSYEKHGGADLAEHLSGRVSTSGALNRAEQNLFFVKTNEVGFNYNIKGDLIAKFILEVSEEFDFILIEPNSLDFKNLQLFLSVSTEAFVLTSQDLAVLKNTKKILNQLKSFKNITNVKLILNRIKIIGELNKQFLDEEEISRFLRAEIIFSFPEFFRGNIFVESLSEKAAFEKYFCDSVLSNSWIEVDYKRKYRGLFGFFRKKLYKKFEC